LAKLAMSMIDGTLLRAAEEITVPRWTPTRGYRGFDFGIAVHAHGDRLDRQRSSGGLEGAQVKVSATRRCVGVEHAPDPKRLSPASAEPTHGPERVLTGSW
jgi:hypothetical protein